jgi:hypothetical protein
MPGYPMSMLLFGGPETRTAAAITAAESGRAPKSYGGCAINSGACLFLFMWFPHLKDVALGLHASLFI